MQQLNILEHLNFRENDKRIKQKVVNQKILTVPRSRFAQENQSVSGNSGDGQKKMSIASSTTSKSKGKQGRLLLRDYLYLTNKNAQTLKSTSKSKDKNQLRKDKYRLDQQKIFYLMQDQMKQQLYEVIQRFQKMNDNFHTKSLRNQQKNNNQNIALIYSIRNIIKDKFKKGIEDINMILFQEQRRKFQMLNPNIVAKGQGDGVELFRSDNCFNKKIFRKKQHKISLQIEKDLKNENRENAIKINGIKDMVDFV